MSGEASNGGEVCRASGARRAEAELLARVDAVCREPVGLAALARPVRVVVPSRSLREHLSAVLVRSGSRAGLRVQTLHSLALEILERCGEAAAFGEALHPIHVRQRARREPVLRERLDSLEDGYGVVEASVSDLLDAGLDPSHADGLIELLGERGGAQSERAAAVVRIASGLVRDLGAGPVSHRSALFQRAAAHLGVDPERALPTRALFVHGFGDATGVQIDLIEALLKLRGAFVQLDLPPDPVDPSTSPELAFGARFRSRLSGVAQRRSEVGEGVETAPIRVLHAPGIQAEVRAVAERLRSRLDGGAVPERLGVVARDLSNHRLALRRHFGRLGIPFSGCGERGPRGPAGRRLDALLAVLRDGARTPSDRWLEALGGLDQFGHARGRALSAAERSDARLAFHALGAARIEEVASLDMSAELADGEGIRLPVREGLSVSEQVGRPVARRRWLSRSLFDAAVAAARALVARLDPAADGGAESLAHRLEQLRGLAFEDLGWNSNLLGADELREAVLVPGAELPQDFEVSQADFALFVERAFANAGCVDLGGRGGGVQVLNAMEARGRSFDALFVMGLERDVFPRVVSEDPLLPDSLRASLRQLLPDLPVKWEGYDEERHIFAQLLTAASEVILTCAVTDDDGKPRALSPLLEALRLVERADPPRRVAGPQTAASLEREPGAPLRLRPAWEHAQLAGLHGSREQFAALLPAAVEESILGLDGLADESVALARLRAAVLSEVDPRRARRARLGPYYGFVGAPRASADPRRDPLFVTTAEDLAGCPWHALLTRVLRLEQTFDAGGSLPGLDPRLLGSLVHRVLEAIVVEVTGPSDEDLSAVLGREPMRIAWPEPEHLTALAREHARQLLREEGIGIAGFDRVLARHALARLEQAHLADWPGPGAPEAVLGAEVHGSVRVAEAGGAEHTLHFRADRMDCTPTGLRLIDYKSGKPFARQQGEKYRRQRHLRDVASGQRLQVPAYALAGAATDVTGAEGRYVFLHPDGPAHARVLGASADDEEFSARFTRSVAAIAEALGRGSFFPRLEELRVEREPRRCTGCEVKSACLRGDSGARARLVDWTEQAAQAGEGLTDSDFTDSERALLRLWRLGEDTA